MKLGWTRVRLSPGPLCRKAERPVEGANDASLLRRVAPGLPIFFGAIAKLVRQRTANPLSLVRIQVAPWGCSVVVNIPDCHSGDREFKSRQSRYS